MKLTPRAGGERGSAAAPVLQPGESPGGSGRLRPRTLPLRLPLRSSDTGLAWREGRAWDDRFPRCPGGQGQPRPPALAFCGEELWGTGGPLAPLPLVSPAAAIAGRLSPFTSRFTCGISISDDDEGGGGGGSSGAGGAQGGGADRRFGGLGAARLPAGAEEVSVLIAVNECHRQKEKQKLPPKIPGQNLARLLKTPISRG